MIAVNNSRTPKYNDRVPVARFVLTLMRDGDKLVLDADQPKCYSDFNSFTGAEKDAYNYIVRLILDNGVEAMRRAESDSAERAGNEERY